MRSMRQTALNRPKWDGHLEIAVMWTVLEVELKTSLSGTPPHPHKISSRHAYLLLLSVSTDFPSHLSLN